MDKKDGDSGCSFVVNDIRYATKITCMVVTSVGVSIFVGYRRQIKSKMKPRLFADEQGRNG